jgi:hypothetical protein
MRRLLTAGLGLMLLGVFAVGQDRVRDRVREVDRTRTAAASVTRKASQIMGSRVSIRGGDTLGKVHDLVIDESGYIDYLIVRYRDEFLAVPWGAVRFDPRDRLFTVTTRVERDRLKDVMFPSDRWPDFYSPRWIRSAGAVWGERAIRRRDIENRGTRGTRPIDRRPPVERPTPPPGRPVPPGDRPPPP